MTPSPKKSRRFDPQLYESITLFGEEFQIQPRSDIVTMRYAASGAKGTVYKLMSKHTKMVHGFKVFRPRYRSPEILFSCEQLKLVENYEGMQAAKRRIVMPNDPIVHLYPDLEYAVLMPWVGGDTWYDVLVKKKLYPIDTGVGLCNRFLTVMEGLEKSGMAHTDIAPGNVVVRPANIDTQLLDLEDLYTPRARRPARENLGQDGYKHQSAEKGKTLWCPEGDRYATAVLAAEILVMTDPRLARHAGDTGYFGGNCKDVKSQERFDAAEKYLRSLAPDFAKVFKDSWWNDSLDRCPRIADLRTAMSSAGKTAAIAVEIDPAAFFDGSAITPGTARRPKEATPRRADSLEETPSSSGNGFSWSIQEPRARPAAPAPAKKSRKRRGKLALIIGLLIALALLLAIAISSSH